MDRRSFISKSGISAAGLLGGSTVGIAMEQSAKERNEVRLSTAKRYNIMQDAAAYRKLDAHCHTYLFDGGPENNIAMADRVFINKMVICRPAYEGKGTPEEFRHYNDLIYGAVQKYPNRFIGQFTLNVQFQKESLEEIKRNVDRGMVGLKVYTQVKINDPLFYPIIEKMIDLKMIIHMHSNCQLGVGGYRMKYDTGIRPQTSIPEDFVDAAQRYPECDFQYAHIGGGGDFEYACKMFAEQKNIYVDTSGSHNPEYMVDFAVQELGEDRIFFGTDNCYYQGVGKMLASKLSEAQRKKVFFDNYNRILKKSGNHAD